MHEQLFSNVEQIQDVNRTLLELMEQSTVGQAFRHLGPFLKLYAMYANSHQQALAVLQVGQHCGTGPDTSDSLTGWPGPDSPTGGTGPDSLTGRSALWDRP